MTTSIDDTFYAARILMWVEWCRNEDDPETGQTWDEIYSRYQWAFGVMEQLDNAPDTIDGYDGEDSDDLYSNAVENIECALGRRVR